MDNKNKQDIVKVKGFFEKAILSAQMLLDKNYTGLTTFGRVVLIASVVYLFSPIDIVPDITIPFVGYLDDMAVLTFAFNLIEKELIKYKKFKNSFRYVK